MGHSNPLVRHPVVCVNGYVMSVQGSSQHYCMPKENHANQYAEVECRLDKPPFPGPAWNAVKVCGDGGDIYAYVPIQLVLDLIQENGGMRSGDMPPSPACNKARLRWAKHAFSDEDQEDA